MANDDERTIKEKLLDGEFVRVGRSLYGYCYRCRCTVKLNKKLFGAMHICR